MPQCGKVQHPIYPSISFVADRLQFVSRSDHLAVDLYSIYPDDIRAANLAYAAKLQEDPNSNRSDRLCALSVVDLLDELAHRVGPARWMRLNHVSTVSFFAYDPVSLGASERQNSQVVIWCRPRYSEVQYLLPVEHRPWVWANAVAIEISDAVELVLDALVRCETRREHLVENVS